MAKINILRVAMQRHRVGLISNDQLSDEFERVLDHMTEFTRNFEYFRGKLRKYEKGRLKEYEDTLKKTNRAIEKKSYEEVVKSVPLINKLRKKIDLSIEAILEYDATKELLKEIQIVLASQLGKLPTILIIEDALAEAQKLMLAGEYLQALTLIRFSSLESAHVWGEKNQERNDVLRAQLEKRIEHLNLICKETKKYAKDMDGEGFDMRGRVTTMLYKFMDERQWELVEKLVSDLEFVLKGRESFRERVKNHPDIAEQEEAEIRTRLKEEGWTEAANYILFYNYQAFQQELGETERLLDQVQSTVSENK